MQAKDRWKMLKNALVAVRFSSNGEVNKEENNFIISLVG